jgi:hypothetical protein
MPVVDALCLIPIEHDDTWVVSFASGRPGLTRLGPGRMPIIRLQSLSRAELPLNAMPVSVLSRATPMDWTGGEVCCPALLSKPENGPLSAYILASVAVGSWTRLAKTANIGLPYPHQHAIPTEAACS